MILLLIVPVATRIVFHKTHAEIMPKLCVFSLREPFDAISPAVFFTTRQHFVVMNQHHLTTFVLGVIKIELEVTEFEQYNNKCRLGVPNFELGVSAFEPGAPIFRILTPSDAKYAE